MILDILKGIAYVIVFGGISRWLLDWIPLYLDNQKALREWQVEHRQWASYPRSSEEPKRPAMLKYPSKRSLGVSLLGLVMVIALSGAVQIPATHIGVAENQFTGTFFVVEPGLHIWPLDPRITPFVVSMTKYDLRRQIIEIGAEPAKKSGVQADSNSPGRPVVFFFARGWAYPNRETIVELHRKYSKTYLDNWVERVWISSLKGIQGEKPYDYVGNYRVQMENDVEKALQLQLIGDNEKPLVFVSQLAIVDFDYDDNVSGYLNEVSKLEFERQATEQQVIINSKLQEAAKIKAETDFIVAKRGAEASQAAAIAAAEGLAKSTTLQADAEAYRIMTTAESDAKAIELKARAEAAGITLQKEALGGNAQLYVELKRALQWSGQLPNYMFGSGTLPFIDVTPAEK